MPVDRLVINASPLIILFKGGMEDLLPGLFTEILIPGAVWDEMIAGGASDVASLRLSSAAWAKRVEVMSVDPVIMSWDLGLGESEVLSFALNNSGYRAMVDDSAARRCAVALGIQTLGTGGSCVENDNDSACRGLVIEFPCR